MSALQIAALVVVFCLFDILILVVVGQIVRRRVQQERATYLNTLLTVRGANFLGQQSKGKGQLRGNGDLTLTSDALIFDRWLPRSHIEIPLHHITSLENPTRFLGKSVGRALLQVNFMNELGEPDALALWVRDLESVQTGILAAMQA